MEWVVSLETAGDPHAVADDDLARLAGALNGHPAVVEERECGYGATLLVRGPDAQQALSEGLAALHDAERRAGVPALPLVSAEVTASSEVDGAPVPPRRRGLEDIDAV